MECAAGDFFSALSDVLFPWLLDQPLHEAKAMMVSLCEPTDIPSAEFDRDLAALRQQWERAGRTATQVELFRCFPALPDRQCVRPYIALRPLRTDIGRMWAWIAMVLWAGIASFDAPPLITLALRHDDFLLNCLPITCPPHKRRDAVARQVLDELEPPPTLGVLYLGVMFAGMGPLEIEMAPFSTARGESQPTVARGGAIQVHWVDGNDLFSLFRPAVSAADFRQLIVAWFQAIEAGITPEAAS